MRELRGAAVIRALLAGLLLVQGACGLDHGFRGVAVDPPRDMPAFTFTRVDGSTFSTAPEARRPMMLFFGYTHCPDVCPTTMADWQRVKRALGDDAARVRFVFVSIDPERDTPDLVDRYARQFDDTFIGLSGDSATTARIQEAFGVASVREPSTSAAGYLMSHSSQVFLLDDRGRLVALYAFGSGWDTLRDDLKHLL